MRTHLLLVAALIAAAASANATTITNGNLSMGLFDNAGLGSGGVGLALVGTGDAITPGCLCEGWGVSGNGIGYNVYGGGDNFATRAISGVTASTATSTITTANGLSVVHAFTPVAGKTLFASTITITNTTGATINDVRYARTLDWDVPVGHFSDDFSTIYAGPGGAPSGKILHTSLDPFAPPNPTVTRGTFANQNRVDEPGDLGGYFIFTFGDLLAGESTSFETVIGAAGSPLLLLADFGALDVEAYSYTFDDGATTTFGYGFVGLGLPPIDTPTPASLAIFGLGLAGIAAARRARR